MNYFLISNPLKLLNFTYNSQMTVECKKKKKMIIIKNKEENREKEEEEKNLTRG